MDVEEEVSLIDNRLLISIVVSRQIPVIGDDMSKSRSLAFACVSLQLHTENWFLARH